MSQWNNIGRVGILDCTLRLHLLVLSPACACFAEFVYWTHLFRENNKFIQYLARPFSGISKARYT